MSGFETLALVAGLAGTGVSAIAQSKAGDAQAQSMEMEARAMERKANEDRAASQREAIRRGREADKVLSRQQALAASSGGSATDSTILDIMGDTAAEGFYQTQSAIYEGESRGRGLESQAAISRYKADHARTAGRLNAFSTTLSGLNTFGTQYKKLKFG